MRQKKSISLHGRNTAQHFREIAQIEAISVPLLQIEVGHQVSSATAKEAGICMNVILLRSFVTRTPMCPGDGQPFRNAVREALPTVRHEQDVRLPIFVTDAGRFFDHPSDG